MLYHVLVVRAVLTNCTGDANGHQIAPSHPAQLHKGAQPDPTGAQHDWRHKQGQNVGVVYSCSLS